MKIEFENTSIEASTDIEEQEDTKYVVPVDKELLTSTATKTEFINSIYKWLMRTLDSMGNSEYKDCFKIEGSSIMCYLPDNYFQNYIIPHGTKIEMKFVSKKG